MAAMPVVTIVIPAYNHATYLPQAIQSVLAQNYPLVELIVIDDGSTDDTASVLARLDGDFRWFTQPNSGQSRTLTRGWSEARGEVLAYLSADDYLETGAVTAAVEALQASNDLVAVYPDFNLVDPMSRVIRRVVAQEFDYNAMLANVICPIGPGAFFKRSAYFRAGSWSPEFRQMPDYDFWLRLGLVGRIERIPRVLAGYRVHEESQTYSVTTEERADEPIRIVRGVLSHPLAHGFSAEVSRLASVNALLVSAQLHIRAGRFRVGAERLAGVVDMKWNALISIRTVRMLFNAFFNRISHRTLWTVRSALKSIGSYASKK